MTATRSDFSFEGQRPKLNSQPILVAEDDPGDEFLLRDAIHQAGLDLQADYVCDGWDVVSYLQNLRPGQLPALLLIDLNLPRLDGFAVLEWLQYRPEFRPAFVVAFSFSALSSDIGRACSLGVDHYLVKPRDPPELVAAVRRMEPYWTEPRDRQIPFSHVSDEVRLAEAV